MRDIAALQQRLIAAFVTVMPQRRGTATVALVA
jgi:hypothetical protein